MYVRQPSCCTHYTATESESKNPFAGEDKEEGQAEDIPRQSLPSEMEGSLDIFLNDLPDAHERGGAFLHLHHQYSASLAGSQIPTKTTTQVLQHFRNSIHQLSIPEEPLLERMLGTVIFSMTVCRLSTDP